MKKIYKPRWRNVVKAVRYSVDPNFGGGNILAWGLGSGRSRYNNAITKPRWRNSAASFSVEGGGGGDAGVVSYDTDPAVIVPSVTYIDPAIITSSTGETIPDGMSTPGVRYDDPLLESDNPLLGYLGGTPNGVNTAQASAAQYAAQVKAIAVKPALSSEMTPIYIAGAIAGIGILALIFKS